MDKRMKLSPDEQAIIEGLRHEKGVWNAALEAVLKILVEADLHPVTQQGLEARIMELMK